MKKDTKKFQKLVRSIEKSNDKFKASTRSQKIVMIAKDVLGMLETNSIKATKGIYVNIPSAITYAEQEPVIEKDETCQLSELLKMPELPPCSVCAIGGAMLASTIRLNRVKVDCQEVEQDGLRLYYRDRGAREHDRTYDSGVFTHITSEVSLRAEAVFPNALLREMEHAFEGGSYGYKGSATNRLRNIYQNLIDNRGRKFTWYNSNSNDDMNNIYSVKD